MLADSSLSHALLLDSGYVDAFFKSGKPPSAITFIAFPPFASLVTLNELLLQAYVVHPNIYLSVKEIRISVPYIIKLTN
jgi:hypothetical protein